MKILIVEDRGSVSYYLEESLKDLGHDTQIAQSIFDAMSYYNNTIECIIIDNNMNPDGLPDNLIDQTHEGLLSGWIWLKNNILDDNPTMRNKTIIFSEYLDDLKRIVPPNELTGIRMVPKRGSSSVAEEVLRHVSEIERLIN